MVVSKGPTENPLEKLGHTPDVEIRTLLRVPYEGVCDKCIADSPYEVTS